MIRNLIKPGDVVLDLGANFGWYTKFMAEIVQNEGKVFCIEPVPLNYNVLEGIIQSLHLDNVQIFHYAISDRNGKQTMAVPLTGSGEENLYEAKIVDDIAISNMHTITVETRTLDTLFADLSKNIEFIKCDVEGHELKCLKGAEKIIKKFHPAWMIEVWGDPDDVSSQGYETFQLLTHAGYQPYIYDGQRLYKRKTGDLQNDYFFLSLSHIERLQRANLIDIVSE
ncbi:MAG: FkbM family methyltransferase [Bacteroidota bacterium]|nr:FkbM family methyltransferase [Bacteroidota bacterium]